MIRSQEIHPVLEEGIDRKRLIELRARFLSINNARLERSLHAMSTRQQQALKLLPLLFHVNHPILPGYTSATTPAGLSGFEPNAEQLAEAQRLSRSFTYKPPRSQGSQPILGLFLIGSIGTLAQAEQSDLDVWVCYDPTLTAAQLTELKRKCDLLQRWAAEQGSEAHFFLVDPERFTRGDRDAQLTSDDCGTTQHYLLLDEFYRTAIWLGGRTPLWWLVPAYEEYRYDAYVATLLERRFVRSEEVLDLGSLGSIPPGEFLGAGLWQLYKSLESPYKSLFKLMLVEVYASEYPQPRCLSLDFKHAVYANQQSLVELDPYLAAYRRIEHYLTARGDHQRLEVVRRCLYLKVNKPLSRPPNNRNKSWQRQLLEQLTRAWGWDERQLAALDARNQWKVRQVDQQRRALNNELTYGYRFLSDFARRLKIPSAINSRDFHVIGRRLQAAIQRKAGKVETINLGISPDMAEPSLTLVHGRDQSSEVVWALFKGNLNAIELTSHSPLKRARDLIPLLAWSHRNGIVDSATRISLHPGDSSMSEAELFALLTDLRQAFPLPLAPIQDDAWLAASTPAQVLLLVNIGIDPFDPTLPQHARQSSEQDASSNQPPARENLVISIDQVVLNSWNEMFVSRYDGLQALPDCLRDYLQSIAQGSARPELQVRSFYRNWPREISRRVEQIFDDARNSFDEADGNRYLLQVRQQFHLLERSDGQVRNICLDTPALIEHLGQAHHRYRPVRLDQNALHNHDLSQILSLGQPDCLQVFYRAQGETAELSVLDECNALWRQQVPYRDEQSLLMPLLRFLKATMYRRQAQRSLDDHGAELEILFYELPPMQSERPSQVERRNAPRGEVNVPHHDVQAIVESRDGEPEQVILYCNHQEFSALEYGADLFAAVARYILSQRRANERYPCYITDLDLSGRHGTGPIQTVQYLSYKAHLETELNRALASL